MCKLFIKIVQTQPQNQLNIPTQPDYDYFKLMPGQFSRFFSVFVCINFGILKYQASFCFQTGFFALKSGKLTI